MDPRKPILWVHEEALGPANPALQDYPSAPGLFVFDDAWIQDQAISRKRIGFLYESALSLPLTLKRGDVAAEVLRFAQRHGADAVSYTHLRAHETVLDLVCRLLTAET